MYTSMHSFSPGPNFASNSSVSFMLERSIGVPVLDAIVFELTRGHSALAISDNFHTYKGTPRARTHRLERKFVGF